MVSGSAVVIPFVQFRMNCEGCWFESWMRRTVTRASKIRRYSEKCIKVQTKGIGGKGGKKMTSTSMSIQKIDHNGRESLEEMTFHWRKKKAQCFCCFSNFKSEIMQSIFWLYLDSANYGGWNENVQGRHGVDGKGLVEDLSAQDWYSDSLGSILGAGMVL